MHQRNNNISLTIGDIAILQLGRNRIGCDNRISKRQPVRRRSRRQARRILSDGSDVSNGHITNFYGEIRIVNLVSATNIRPQIWEIHEGKNPVTKICIRHVKLVITHGRHQQIQRI